MGDSDASPAQKDDWKRRLVSWLQSEIDNSQHLLEVELLALGLSTGIIDTVTYPEYKCFVSNQTGNTVLFAVTAFSLLGPKQSTSFREPAPHLAVSLGFFCIGVFAAGQTANRLGCAFRRWWLLLTNALQTAMVLIAALINHRYDSAGKVSTAPILCSVALLAFAAGTQVAVARQLQMPEIPTTQATSAYVDLFVDPQFFGPIAKSRSRNRRVAFILMLVAGSFVGAPAYHYVGAGFAVLLAGVVKFVITIAFVFNRRQKEENKRLHA